MRGFFIGNFAPFVGGKNQPALNVSDIIYAVELIVFNKDYSEALLVFSDP
jgi:hypothetical protein